MKESHRQQFLWAPHTSGATTVKPRDYEEGGLVESSSPYAAWKELRESEQPLRVGDLLELEDGSLRIFKYVGLEEASWFVPPPAEPPAAAEAVNPTPGQAA